MDEWYYTKNNQQMGPVSWDELRQLAASGMLKPTDMVWKEGMNQWVKAAQREGLFAAKRPQRAERAPVEEVEERPRRRAASPARGDDVDDDRPRRIRRDDAGEDDDRADDDDDDDRPRRRRRAAASGMPLGAKVAIIGGSVAIGLLVVVVVIILVLRGGGSPPGSYTIPNLMPMQKHFAEFNFTGGRQVTIRVTSTVTDPRTDVDLIIERLNGQRIAADVAISKDATVVFAPAANERLRVNVVNLGPGSATCMVNIN